ncbi:hypothetical protein K435DRAFT_312245, partial [Dendrothele bispora CBS 962.96]
HPRNVLPPLTFFPFLHTLRLDDFGFVDPISRTTLIDPTYFREASSVEHLHLVNTSAEALFPVPRSREYVKCSNSKTSFYSVQEITLPLLTPGRDERDTTNTSANDLIRDFSTTTVIPSPFSSNSLPTDPIPLPSLETLTLDSIRYQDIMWLCELVANRQSHVPSSSSSVKRVCLSKSSMKHLRTGFTLEINLKDKSNSNTKSGSGRGRGLEGLTSGSTAIVNSDTRPTTAVARVFSKVFTEHRFNRFSPPPDTSHFSPSSLPRLDESGGEEKKSEDDGFTLEWWLRDRVDVCELENEEDV